MGFFSSFIGGIKKATHSVVGAVKTATKSVGHAVQSGLDYSREHSIGSTMQSVGAALALSGLAVGSTGVGAPVAAAMETLAGGLNLAGTGLRAAEVASNQKIGVGEKLTRAATDVALPLLLAGAPMAGKLAGSGIRAGGKAGLTAALQASRPASGMIAASRLNTIKSVGKGIGMAARGAESLGRNAQTIGQVADVSMGAMRAASGKKY